MKHILLIFGLLILAASCNNQQTNSIISPTESEIKIDTLGNNEIENNLKNQLKEYLIAFNGGDPETAIEYCYPDMFVWMKQQFPEEYNKNTVKELFTETINEMKKMAKEKNVSYDFEIGRITKRIDLGSEKLFTVVVSIVAKKDFDEIKRGDEVVAISIDNGINWKFIQKDPETTPDILKMKYSEKVVNELMSKN